MSKSLSAAAQQQFDSDVKHAFQGTGVLKECVTIRNNVVADTYSFRRMGKGLANQKASQADVTPMDIAHTKIPATLTNWNAPEYTDIFDQAEVNFDEQQELAQAIAMALGRRCDQLVIDALQAATPAEDIADGATNLTLAKITAAASALNDKGVPTGDRYFATSAAGLEKMLNSTGITSSDYNSIKVLMSGEIDTWMGFKWKMIETRVEGGLTKTGDIRTCYAWHKTAIGLAIGIDIRSEVNYIAQKTSWLCNGLFKAGAVARDGDGIVHIDIDETK